MDSQNEVATQPTVDNTLLNIAYALYASGILLGGLTTIVGVILAYIKLADTNRASIQGQHLIYLIRTFWHSFFAMIFAFLTAFFGLGIILFFAAGIWYIYRVVFGWIKLTEGKSPYKQLEGV